ncbi:MAG: molybdopterin-dependent oxidoreductase [Ktedonobacterales bacterium]
MIVLQAFLELVKQIGATALRRLRQESIALLAGLLGSLAAVVVMGILRLWWGSPTPPELVGERVLPLMTADQFVALLLQFQPHPKTGPLGLALLGQCVIGILLGPAYALALRSWEKRRGPLPSAVSRSRTATFWWWPGRSAWIIAAAFALGMELVAAATFWPVLPEGLFGDPIEIARLLTLCSLLLTFAAYAAVMAVAYQVFRRAWGAWATGASSGTTTPISGRAKEAAASLEQFFGAPVSRREALLTAGATAAVIAVGGLTVNRLIMEYLAQSNLAYEGHGTPGLLTAPITPNAEFYVVSKNVLDPTVVPDRWRLELAGLIPRAQSWTYDQVLKLPSETRPVTLECISNEVSGNLLSTAIWRGVTLQTLLDLGGGLGSTGGKHVVFFGVDGYATSLPLDDLLQARAFLAWEMNGVPLPDRHGFPLRAVVPGRYGEQSAKWVTRIEITDQDFKGFYQSQGWSAAQLSTLSRIDQPHGQVRLGAVAVSGVAFAGIRGIRRVEVSVDGGSTWSGATLVPPLSDQTWVLWSWSWHPNGPGPYTLLARATDGTGSVQTPVQQGTVPDGATGWPSVKVLVK